MLMAMSMLWVRWGDVVVRASFLSTFFFSKHGLLHLLAQYAGVSSCTVRVRDTMSVSLCATMRSVSMPPVSSA